MYKRQVQKGQPANVALDAFADHTFTGTVTRVQAAEQVQESRLSASRRPHHSDELPWIHVEVHRVQSPHLGGSGAVDLGQPRDVDDGGAGR